MKSIAKQTKSIFILEKIHSISLQFQTLLALGNDMLYSEKTRDWVHSFSLPHLTSMLRLPNTKKGSYKLLPMINTPKKVLFMS